MSEIFKGVLEGSEVSYLLNGIDVDSLYEEITRLKRCIEEKNMIIDTLQLQIDEK